MKYFIIAGEASGDLHAANLMKEIKNLDSKAEFMFLGGDKMQNVGGIMIRHFKDMAFMGIINVVLNLRKVLHNLSDCKKALKNFAPDYLILIDYPSFNLRIAEFCKKNLPKTKVYYYISPKLWAWKEYRIKSIKKWIDRMFTILPFETEFYAKHNFHVEYVGNPSVDSVMLRNNKNESKEDFIQKYGLDNRPIVALLAGSRIQEINGCLPTMIQMQNHFPSYQFVIAGAPSVDKKTYQKIIGTKNIPIIENNTYDLLQQSHAAIVNSGTATLETALFRVPQVVVYNVFGGRLANILKSIVLKIKYVALSNLIAGKEVSKELIAADFTEKNLSIELSKILEGTNREQMLKDYDEIILSLGNPDTAKRAAQKMLQS
jgi:lipid-A-disaccharide synthase